MRSPEEVANEHHTSHRSCSGLLDDLRREGYAIVPSQAKKEELLNTIAWALYEGSIHPGSAAEQALKRLGFDRSMPMVAKTDLVAALREALS